MLYTYDASATYKLVFNDTTPDAPDASELDDLLRLTNIYYSRAIASDFSRAYQDVDVVYEYHDWLTTAADDTEQLQGHYTSLRVDFDILVTLRSNSGVVPNATQVLEKILGINTDIYLKSFVWRAQPNKFFSL